ncbi:AraC family ligand binding domain-containing protein [Frigoribacterium sp. Leaf263]|uniref:AraC family ligand binding domain-containing protein n=1 Tax=Frigoribacterium sp. Leaf263 TaxID=1736313 RepID=UPI0009E824D5|nr:AraC family ligand binding domain-containing protein [Frigoribacterium sp. Leaf263]
MADQPKQVGGGRNVFGDFAPKLAALTDDVLFEDVWNRAELSARDRSLITAGVGRFGTRDGRIIDVHPGQTIYTPPGQEHFHAAAPGVFMEHIAMLENGDDPASTTTWLEHITDDDFAGR